MTTPSGSRTRYDVIVIGAGHNGLTCAAMLARKGRKVLVVERRSVVGGLAVGDEFHSGVQSIGLLHDTSGVRPRVIEALNLEKFGLALNDCVPGTFIPEVEGRGLLLHHDPNEAALELRERSDHDAARYGEYRAFLTRIGQFLRRLLDKPPPVITANGRATTTMQLLSSGLALRRLGRKDMMELLRVVPMSVSDWLGDWFETELIKCVLAGPALSGTFTGPRSPGSAGNLLRLDSLAHRSVVGGPQALIDALEAAARQSGVEIRTSAEVVSIRGSGGQVEGVTLRDGETIDAPIVAASCDPKETWLQLVGVRNMTSKLEKHIVHFRMRGTTAKVNLALSGPLRFACRPNLEIQHARTGETLNELERAFDAVKYRRFSDRPVLDIYVPAGGSNSSTVVSIVAHFAPYKLDGGWTDETREQLGNTIIDALAMYSPDVKKSIVASEVLTPADIEQRFGVTGGHIHHGEHGLDQLLVRPSPECARYATPIAGLYLCGSGSHPGGGLTCAPGALAAETIAT